MLRRFSCLQLLSRSASSKATRQKLRVNLDVLLGEAIAVHRTKQPDIKRVKQPSKQQSKPLLTSKTANSASASISSGSQSKTCDSERVKQPKLKQTLLASDTLASTLHSLKTLPRFIPTHSISLLSSPSSPLSNALSEYELVEHADITKVPQLAHGLSRCLDKSGHHLLKPYESDAYVTREQESTEDDTTEGDAAEGEGDGRSEGYNFDKWLQKITQPCEFDYSLLSPYRISSEDQKLASLSHLHSTPFYTSTSSLTESLCFLYHLFSQNRPTNHTRFSILINDSKFTFPPSSKRDVGINLIEHENGCVAVNKFDLEGENVTILGKLGQSMEKWLTMDKKEFKGMLLENSTLRSEEDKAVVVSDQYNYAKISSFLVRSQIDCYDPNLPKPFFDIKTRSLAQIRYNIENIDKMTHHRLNRDLGKFSSFERELYDLVRGPFMKYGFQARLGQMDGIFVCYHNTLEPFGFQYLSLEEIDQYVYGNNRFAEHTFTLVVRMFGEILERILKGFETKDLNIIFMNLEMLELKQQPDPNTTNTSTTTQSIEKELVKGAVIKVVEKSSGTTKMYSLRTETRFKGKLVDLGKMPLDSFVDYSVEYELLEIK